MPILLHLVQRAACAGLLADSFRCGTQAARQVIEAIRLPLKLLVSGTEGAERWHAQS